MSPAAGAETTATPVADTAPEGAGASRQSTLCAGSWPRPACGRCAFVPAAAARTAPPFASSVSAGTATPAVDRLGFDTS